MCGEQCRNTEIDYVLSKRENFRSLSGTENTYDATLCDTYQILCSCIWTVILLFIHL